MNYRGDALPVVRRERLLTFEGLADVPAHVLVLTDRRSPVPRCFRNTGAMRTMVC